MILVIGGLVLPAGKAWTTPRFPRSRASPSPSNMGSTKSGSSSAKIWVTKTVSSEMLPVPLSVIAIAVGLPSNLHGPVEDRVKRIARDDDGDGARCMVRHIEQGAVRCQGAAPRLGARWDLLHFPAQHEVNDRDGAGDAVGDIRRPVGRVDRHTAGLLADRDLEQLFGDVIAVVVFHLNN